MAPEEVERREKIQQAKKSRKKQFNAKIQNKNGEKNKECDKQNDDDEKKLSEISEFCKLKEEKRRGRNEEAASLDGEVNPGPLIEDKSLNPTEIPLVGKPRSPHNPYSVQSLLQTIPPHQPRLPWFESVLNPLFSNRDNRSLLAMTEFVRQASIMTSWRRGPGLNPLLTSYPGGANVFEKYFRFFEHFRERSEEKLP